MASSTRWTRRWPSQCLIRRRGQRLYHELSYATPGNPSQVLSFRSTSVDPVLLPVLDQNGVTSTMLRVAMLAAPWNPADAMGVQGRYPSPYQKGMTPSAVSLLPETLNDGQVRTVAGSEGLGQVVEIIPATTTTSSTATTTASSAEATTTTVPFQVGDYVVPAQSGLGVYRSTLWSPASAWIRLTRGAELLDTVGGPLAAAPLFQTGGTALAMLNALDRPPLQVGDVIVQNAANSAVGIMVSQLASARGVHCIGLVRQGDTGTKRAQCWDDVVHYLTHHGKSALIVPDVPTDTDAHGTTHAMTTTTATTTTTTTTTAAATLDSLTASLRTISPRLPRLALNAVGGSSASMLLQLLGPSGTMITYGGMSRQPVSIATSQLIFNNVRLTGYWHSRWMACESTPHERSRLVNELVDGVLRGALTCPPIQSYALSRFRDAFEFERQQSEEPMRRKVVFDCREVEQRREHMRN